MILAGEPAGEEANDDNEKGETTHSMCHDNGRSRAWNSVEPPTECYPVYGLELDRLVSFVNHGESCDDGGKS